MSTGRIIAVVCLLAVVGFIMLAVTFYFGEVESRPGSRGTYYDLTGLVLIVGFVIIYRRFKSMQQKIDEMVSDIDELKLDMKRPSLDSDEANGS